MLKRFSDIAGHDKISGALSLALQRGSLAHAYLFGGPEGVGKRSLAMALFAALNCENSRPEPCGHCANCRLLQQGTHPDVRIIEPEGKARIIKIDSVRGLARAVAFPPVAGRWKCILIDDAECFNEAAGNALLKTLEEPASQTVFVLVTSRPHLMLATILSRCQKLYFTALPRELIRDRLIAHHGAEPDAAEAATAMADGSLGRAVGLLDETILETRRTWFGHLGALHSLAPGDVLPLAEGLGGSRDKLEAGMDIARSYLRDVLLLSAGGSPESIANVDTLGALTAHAKRTRPAQVLHWLDTLEDCALSLRVNANPRLVAEQLLLALRHE